MEGLVSALCFHLLAFVFTKEPSQGGAWCNSKEECLKRSKYYPNTGTSKNALPKDFFTIMSHNKSSNPDVEAVDPAILIGASAGGLATILNCDRFHSFLPNASRVKCISDSGFFIQAKDLPGAKDPALPYTFFLRLVPELCFFPENVVDDIQTPLLLLNSNVDSFQVSFQTVFLKTLEEGLDDNPSRGLFINSCYIHGFIHNPSNWQETPTLQNKANNSTSRGGLVFREEHCRLVDTKNSYPINCNN
ncbi:hypothetical protein SASPL_138423 [Salvia splendens]|uniref:Pectin acetylesterase n=1 Tax=Salvia splendens TaxID=180675 RepID=A0A8X8ZED2_SALSN|nr:hypothetical protein SASPL_138423 [Salvia splendens]